MNADLVQTYIDRAGTNIEYVERKNGNDIAVVWLSAFTKGPILGRFTRVSPRFHGFKISKSNANFDWLLIRDSEGLTQDGTYYGGNSENLFVETAVKELIKSKIDEYRAVNQHTEFVLMGSSMGGYGAIKLAILTAIDKVFVYSPHLDMEIAMHHCGRGPWIKYCLTNDLQANQKYLSRLQQLVRDAESLPRLVIQVSKDDNYVYPEQVVPFVNLYSECGGTVELDLRESGGHGSINAPDEYIASVVHCLGKNQEINFEGLKNFPLRELSRQEKIERNLQKVENLAFNTLKFLRIKK
jgi:predicted esterase YcpF (UPF0227 family)